MSSRSIYEIQGFSELQRKIALLPDRVKKREILRILRVAAKPTAAAARIQAPVGDRPHRRYSKRSGAILAEYLPGNLRKSIGNITGRRGRARVNPVLYVGPRSKGRKYDGYYGGMVHDGTRFQTANPFMKRAYNQTRGLVTKAAETKVAKAIQRQIDR